MTRTRRALALLLAILLCTAAIYAWRPGNAPAAEPVAEPAPVPSIEPAAPTTPAPDPAPTLPLPAEVTVRRASESRLADIAPRLQARADAGDADAACRLAVDLMHCRWLAFYGPDAAVRLARQEREKEASGRLEAANDAATLLIQATELQRVCGGIDETLMTRAGHYLRQAALAGHPDAVMRYAAGEMFNLRMGQAIITSREFDPWRREAPRLVEQALAAGEPGAVLLMLHSHAGNAGHLGMLTPPDPLAEQTSLALARRLFGDELPLARFGIPASADPEILKAAQARAAEMHARHFNGERHPAVSSSHAFLVPEDPERNPWLTTDPALPGSRACRPQAGR